MPGKHGRPTWRDRFSNLNQAHFRPMKPRRSQSHIPNCASCCSKSSAADTQWKIPEMCVRGCSLASIWFNYKDERRLVGNHLMQGELVFVWGCASFCIGFFAYHTCMFMVIRLPCTYLCIFSAVLVRLCIFCCVANRCVYSAECDGCACRECHVHCSTRWCESCQWQWYLLKVCH